MILVKLKNWDDKFSNRQYKVNDYIYLEDVCNFLNNILYRLKSMYVSTSKKDTSYLRAFFGLSFLFPDNLEDRFFEDFIIPAYHNCYEAFYS